MANFIIKILAVGLSMLYSLFGVIGIGTGAGGSHSYTTKTISYGTNSEQKLDIYIPDNAQQNDANGIIVFVHGGAWVMGKRGDMKAYCKSYAKAGYITATIDYRMPEYNAADLVASGLTAKTICQDIRTSLGAIKAYTETQGINVTNCVLFGDSAGAHEAMLYAYDNSYPKPINISFVVDRSGPTNLDPSYWENYNLLYSSTFVNGMCTLLAGNVAAMLPKTAAGKKAIQSISPITYVNENTVPTLMCYGAKDKLVPTSNGTQLRDKFAALGVPYAFFSYKKSGHMLNLDLSVDKEFENTFAQWLNFYFGY